MDNGLIMDYMKPTCALDGPKYMLYGYKYMSLNKITKVIIKFVHKTKESNANYWMLFFQNFRCSQYMLFYTNSGILEMKVLVSMNFFQKKLKI